jgi:hypothetical protein
MVANRASSHANLALEHRRADQDHHGWQAFLERAQTRAADKTTGEVPDEVPEDSAHGFPAIYPTDQDVSLYRVPVHVSRFYLLCFEDC